jgi:hypothetical protein
MGHMGQSSVNGKHNHTSYPSRFHLRTSQASRLRPATVERLWRGEFSGGILRVFWGEITKKPCWLITYNLKHYGFLGYISYIELVHEVYKPRNQETWLLMFSDLIALIRLGSQLGESSPGTPGWTSNNLRSPSRKKNVSGWWLTYLSEKLWLRQLEWWHSQLNGKS